MKGMKGETVFHWALMGLAVVNACFAEVALVYVVEAVGLERVCLEEWRQRDDGRVGLRGDLDKDVLELVGGQEDYAEGDGERYFPQAGADVHLGPDRLQVALVGGEGDLEAGEFEVAVDVVLPPVDGSEQDGDGRFP